MTLNIAFLIGTLVLVFILIPIWKRLKKRPEPLKILKSTTELPKHQQVEHVNFYLDFICKTRHNDHIETKKCSDIFTFGG